jgi:ligand-binding sensor domain-containing protein
MKKNFQFKLISSLFLILIAGTSISQPATIDCSKLKPVDPYFVKTLDTISTRGPVSITRNILQDKKGNFWFASWQGIMKYDGKVFTNYTLKENLINFHVFSVLEDKSDNIWFGTIRGGVYMYKPEKNGEGGTFTLFTTKDGLASDIVGCIFEDKKGNIWFGTDMGVSCYNPSASISPGAKTGLTTLSGLVIKSKKSFTNFTTKDGLSNNDVNAIVEDNTGKLWFGTRGEGVCFYDPSDSLSADGKMFHNFKNKEGLPFNQVRSIIKDKKGNLWFGGNDGLWRYNLSTSLSTSEKSFTQLGTNFVGYIYEDKKGNIWTGSEGENSRNWVLTRYNPEKNGAGEKSEPVIIKKQAGQIFGIIEDTNGNIWFGTERGVCRYDPSVELRTDSKSFTEFRDYLAK